MTIGLLLGPTVDVDAIALVLDFERRGYALTVDDGETYVRPSAGLTRHDAERWRRHRRDLAEIVEYCANPPSRPWS